MVSLHSNKTERHDQDDEDGESPLRNISVVTEKIDNRQ